MGVNDGSFQEDSFKHLVMTRFWFQKAANGHDSGSRPDPTWFEGRVGLFKTYCLPSITTQSIQDFTWIIYFDACTPAEYLDRMREIVKPFSYIQIRILGAFEADLIRNDVVTEVDGKAAWVLTTRVDTDDGWHCDFVKRLHEAVRIEKKRAFFNFPAGIIAYNERAYLYRHRSNAFISLFEPAKSPLTVYCAPHEQLHRWAPIRQLDPRPAFLQVVHGTNLSNKPRGTRVHKALAFQGFEEIPALFDAPLDESDSSILFENVTTGLVWRARDKFLDAAKALLLRKRSN